MNMTHYNNFKVRRIFGSFNHSLAEGMAVQHFMIGRFTNLAHSCIVDLVILTKKRV